MELNIAKVKPVKGKVLIELQHAAVKSKGGLFIPDAEHRRSPLGKVLRTADDSKLNVGSLVYFDLHEGTRVDETHMILKEEFVYADFIKEEE